MNSSKKSEKKFYSTVRQFNLVDKGDTIAVALSGEANSSVALYLMNELQKKLPFDLFAITIDEGGAHRTESIKKAKELCEKLKIKHHIFSFKDSYDVRLDEIAKKTDGVCTYCSILRRSLINKKARELKANKIVFSHTKDDFARNFIACIMKNETMKLTRFAPSFSIPNQSNFLTKIKPLALLEEDEVLDYAKAEEIPYFPKSCPHKKNPLHNQIGKFLNSIEEKYPGAKENVIQSYFFIAESIRNEMRRMGNTEEGVKNCKTCGEPASEGICMVCKLLGEIKAGGELRYGEEY